MTNTINDLEAQAAITSLQALDEKYAKEAEQLRARLKEIAQKRKPWRNSLRAMGADMGEKASPSDLQLQELLARALDDESPLAREPLLKAVLALAKKQGFAGGGIALGLDRLLDNGPFLSTANGYSNPK